MIKEEHFAAKRVWRLLLMTAGMIAFSAVMSYRFQFLIDSVLAMILLQVLFFPIFILFLETERLGGHLYGNKTTSYRVIAPVFLLVLLFYFVFTFLPPYLVPALIPAVLMTAVSNPAVGTIVSVYLNLLICMVSEGGYYELAVYLILSMTGVLLVPWLEKKKNLLCIFVIILGISVVLPELFYYFGTGERGQYLLGGGALCGIAETAFVMIFFGHFRERAKTEYARSIKEIIEPKFSLVKELKEYSEVDFLHAQNVSKTAYQCALLIGADADVAAAAGFYYRLGRIEGEPFVANGVARAQANCFPEKVVQILSEYNGEEKLPSTKESAIVHMVDAVIAKFELLDKDTLSNTWNHNIVIYQTLDEKSSSGIYDDSGLGMNQYLKIREYLVKGVNLS